MDNKEIIEYTPEGMLVRETKKLCNANEAIFTVKQTTKLNTYFIEPQNGWWSSKRIKTVRRKPVKKGGVWFVRLWNSLFEIVGYRVVDIDNVLIGYLLLDMET